VEQLPGHRGFAHATFAGKEHVLGGLFNEIHLGSFENLQGRKSVAVIAPLH
jgi:hypothetical protein